MKKSVSDTARMQDLRKRAAAMRSERPKSKKYARKDALDLIRELQLQQVELEMQNHELKSVQSRVEESRQKYSELYDFSPVCFFTLDSSGTITEVNLMGAALLKVDRQVLIGKPILLFIAPDDRAVFESYSRQVFSSLKNSDFTKKKCELKIMRKDGSFFYGLLESAPIKVGPGEVPLMSMTVIDISDQKNMAFALKETLEHLEKSVLERTAELSVRNTQLEEEIRERKRIEEALRRSERELNFRNRIADLFLRHAGRDVYSEVLKIILEEMKSPMGVFAYVDQEGLLSGTALPRKKGESEVIYRFPRQVWADTIWAPAFMKNETVCCNKECGLPTDGRARRAVMSPIVHRDHRVGFLWIGNKKTDYTEEDREGLGRLASYIAPILHARLQRDFLDFKRREAEDQLTESREQLRALAANLEEVREEERKVIAREIHDEFGQALTCLKMDLSYVSKRMRDDQKDLLEKVNSMMRMIDYNIQLIRDVSSQLRPGILDDFGLLSAIEWQLQSFHLRTGIKYTIHSNLNGKDLVPKIQTALFRVFQEALTNVMRHSEATEVRIELQTDPENVLLMRIDDNGKGIQESAVKDLKSLGIFGMRERIDLLGGYFQIEGVPGKGTSIQVSIPT